MRIFVAIPLNAEMKTAVTAAMHELKKAGVKGNYVPAQNLHLTLAFIGEWDDGPAVKDALRKVDFKPFRLTLSGMGSFEDVLWVGVKGNQGLGALEKAVRAALDEAGISYDRKKFVPHITVIRKAAGRWQQVKAPEGETMVKTFSLMKSEQKDGRVLYKEIGVF